jgi:hypothetical protein
MSTALDFIRENYGDDEPQTDDEPEKISSEIIESSQKCELSLYVKKTQYSPKLNNIQVVKENIKTSITGLTVLYFIYFLGAYFIIKGEVGAANIEECAVKMVNIDGLATTLQEGMNLCAQSRFDLTNLGIPGLEKILTATEVYETVNNLPGIKQIMYTIDIVTRASELVCSVSNFLISGLNSAYKISQGNKDITEFGNAAIVITSLVILYTVLNKITTLMVSIFGKPTNEEKTYKLTETQLSSLVKRGGRKKKYGGNPMSIDISLIKTKIEEVFGQNYLIEIENKIQSLMDKKDIDFSKNQARRNVMIKDTESKLKEKMAVIKTTSTSTNSQNILSIKQPSMSRSISKKNKKKPLSKRTRKSRGSPINNNKNTIKSKKPFINPNSNYYTTVE